MPDSQYFSKLRAFFCGRPHSQSTGSRRTKWRAVPVLRATTFALQQLESRVLLAADLAGAVQAAHVVEAAPIEPQAATLLEEQSAANQPLRSQAEAH